MPCRINNANGQRPLSEKTIAVTARHRNGELEFDVHNLYSLYQVRATHTTLQALAPKRPFILTRSTWLGSGSLAAHWTGDTASTWCAPAQLFLASPSPCVACCFDHCSTIAPHRKGIPSWLPTYGSEVPLVCCILAVVAVSRSSRLPCVRSIRLQREG